MVPVVTTVPKAMQILTAAHHGRGEWLQTLDNQGADGWEETEAVGAHLASLGNHWGRDKTLQMVLERWKFPPTIKVKETVQDIINRCEVCQRTRGISLQKTGATMHAHKRPKLPFRQWGVDCFGPMKEGLDGYKYVINAVDFMSKWVVSGVLKDKSMVSIARFFYERIFCVYGPPRVIITDQGSEFNNCLTKAIDHLIKLDHRCTHAYHPQSNGLVERMNGTIQRALTKHIEEDPGSWVLALPGVIWNINTTIQASTKYAPFHVLFGVRPRLPFAADFEEEEVLPAIPDPANPHNICLDDADKDDMEWLHGPRQLIYEAAIRNNKKAELHQVYNYNKRHGLKMVYKEGDRVWKWNAKDAARKEKCKSKWTGPYTVIEVSSSQGYKLKSQGHVGKRWVPQRQLMPYLDADKKVIKPSRRFLQCLGAESVQIIDGKIFADGEPIEEEEDDVLPESQEVGPPVFTQSQSQSQGTQPTSQDADTPSSGSFSTPTPSPPPTPPVRQDHIIINMEPEREETIINIELDDESAPPPPPATLGTLAEDAGSDIDELSEIECDSTPTFGPSKFANENLQRKIRFAEGLDLEVTSDIFSPVATRAQRAQRKAKIITSTPTKSCLKADIQCTGEDIADLPYFNPLTDTDMKMICRVKALAYQRPVHYSDRGNRLTHNPPLEPIIGDGNCFFRAVSFSLAGTQDRHWLVRQQICDHLNKNFEQFRVHLPPKYMKGSANDYFRGTSMKSFGKWATDLELMVAAQLYQRDIYCYVNGAYHCHRADPDGDVYTKNAIYIWNGSGFHFDVIVGCNKPSGLFKKVTAEVRRFRLGSRTSKK